VAALPLETRATIGNMSPEYGATCTMFPIDQVTLDYLRFTGRDEEHLALVETYAKAQGLGDRDISDFVEAAERATGLRLELRPEDGA